VQDLNEFEWEQGETCFVEFFPGLFSKVTYLSSDSPYLDSVLLRIHQDDPICLDLEWKPDLDQTNHEVSIFQFATSTETLVIKHPLGTPNRSLLHFLNTHKFIGKATVFDRQKLHDKFGETLHIDLEDIEQTRLRPRGLSLNFNIMVDQFAGTPTIPFKDKHQ